MSRSLKLVKVFAASGFCVAWLLLGYSALSFRLGIHLSEVAFLVLCPTSILSIGLDGASAWIAFLGWLLIAVSNAMLYGVLGFVASVLYHVSN